MQVRTFAEEVYTQMVAPEVSDAGEAQGAMIARAVAAAAPLMLGWAALVVVLAGRWERNLPPAAAAPAPPLRFPLGRWRRPLCAAAAAASVALLAVPLASLAWRAGLEGTPPVWSAAALDAHLIRTARTDGDTLTGSLGLAAASGAVGAGLAFAACWAALGAPRFRNGVLVLMALAWATPGPVVGLGLKETILRLLELLDAVHAPWLLDRALWSGPSPLPLLWVNTIRFFPYAVAILWPVVRLTPPELAMRPAWTAPHRRASLDSWPCRCTRRRSCGRPWRWACCPWERSSAGKLVSTPGWDSFAEVVWTQMHYGVTNNLAALCLLMLAAVAAGAALTALRFSTSPERKRGG